MSPRRSIPSHRYLLLPVLAAAAALAVAGPAAARGPAGPTAAQAPLPDIPYTRFVLDNGLTLLVHEDHKAPIVAVNIWYHVGSKNEKPGKTGFAHLFEHLMFNGSENAPGDYFFPMENVGATDLNGTTNDDRTNYFENVPTSALDLALFMESDRMGHLLGVLDQAKLDEQRGVVQNEKRQGENQPYGVTRQLLAENTYPEGHPYHWTTIGSMEDLDAATLDDVREWFKTYYGPNNAVLAIAGDIDPETARQKVEHWFGDIPPGPPLARQDAWVARMSGEHRLQVQDRVPQARLYKVWNVPQWGSAAADYLDLAAAVLSSGKSSRLYKRLVYDEQIATDVWARVWDQELGSQFTITATAKPGQELAAIEKAVDEELARFLTDGPTAAELERVKAASRARFIYGAERIGGFGGKSDILASNLVLGGDPHFYEVSQGRIAAATPAVVRQTARDWLSDGVFVLEVTPYPDLTAAAEGADRSSPPAVAAPPAPVFPALETAELANGLKIVLASRPTSPQVQLELLVNAGYAADSGGLPGTASLTMDMLDEGTGKMDALAISDALDRLGARLRTGADVDFCNVSLTTLNTTLDEALGIFADVVLRPTFPENELDRLKQQQIAGIKREKTTPQQMAMRVMPALLYGEGHAYALPLTGSGTEESVAKIGRQQVVDFHRTWFRPNNATLVVAGNTTMDRIKPRLEKLLGGWEAGQVPQKAVGAVAARSGPALYLIDRPGSQQSIVYAGELAPPPSDPQEITIETVNRILGGSFTSRINMNLRENKHWTYGARSMIVDARGQRPYLAYAPVQGDKTAETIQEIHKELAGITGAIPVTEDELSKAKAGLTLTLPGRWETTRAITGSVADIVRFDLPHDYYDHYPQAVAAVQTSDIASVARRIIHPDDIVWVVVGDREKIEPSLQELGLGEIHYIDADGRPVVPGAQAATMPPERPHRRGGPRTDQGTRPGN